MAKLNFVKIGTKAAGLAVGGVGAKFMVNKVAPNLDPKLKNIGAVIVGALLPEFLGKRSPFMQDVGNGMMTIGGVGLVGGFVPALAGVNDEWDEDFDESIGDEDEYDTDDDDDDNAIGSEG